MAYANKFRMGFTDQNENNYSLFILEDGYSGGVTQLKGTGSPVVYQTIDNDEQAYKAIQASQLAINIVDEGNFNLKEFIESAATETFYKVELYSATKLIWTGFIDTQGCSEDMVDVPKVVSLIASDGIGYLKNEAFTNHEDIFQYGKYKLLVILEWCIAKTNLPLDLRIAVSVFEESMQTRDDNPAAHPFDQCKIHTRSIKEKNCYEIIEAICETFSASFYQFDGSWWIDRKHDRWNDRYHAASVLTYPYALATATVENHTYRPTDFTPLVGHVRFYLSPLKSAKTTYDFKVPEDIPRNKIFDGDFAAPLSGPSNVANYIDAWAYEMGTISSPTPVSTDPYRNQVYDALGNIKETYIVLPRDTPTGTDTERLICEGIEVSEFDKVTIAFTHRLKFGVGSSGSMIVAQIILYGDSGQKYTLDPDDLDDKDQAAWFPTLTSSTGQTFTRAYSGSDLETWKEYSATSQPFPEDGVLTLWLYESSPSVTGNESWFRAVKMSFELFINDTLRIIGERAGNSQDGVFRDTYENTLIIADAPKKIISGALFRLINDTELTTLWYLSGIEDGGKKLIQLHNRAQYQLGYRYKTKVQGDIINPLYPDPPATGRCIFAPNAEIEYSTMPGVKYLGTNLSIDFNNCRGNLTLKEFYNGSEISNAVGDSETINYLYD